MDSIHSQLYRLRQLMLTSDHPINYITDDKQLADVLDVLLYKLQLAEGHYFDPVYVTPKQLRCIKHCCEMNYLNTVMKLISVIEGLYQEKCEAGTRKCQCAKYINTGACEHLCPCCDYAFYCDSTIEDIKEATKHAITSIAKDRGLI